MALLDLQGQRFVHDGDKSGGNHCPEKMHYIQGADDLLDEMRWPVGQEGIARLLGADDAALDALDDGARFKVEVNGGVPVHIDESFDKHNQHNRQVHPAASLVSKVVVVYYCCCGGPEAYGAHRRRRC